MTITRIHLTDTCHRLAHEAVRISRLPVSDPAEIRNAAADALRDLAAHFVATRRALLDVMSAAGAHVETWCEDDASVMDYAVSGLDNALDDVGPDWAPDCTKDAAL